MSNEVEHILDICLNELRAGADIDSLLMRFPNHATELRPLLELSLAMEQLPIPQPSPEKVSATLVKIGKEISRESRKPKKSWGNMFFRQPKFAWITSGVLALIFTIITMSTLSAQSVPGDFLYPVKLITEKVKFILTLNSENKAELRLSFSGKRLNEILKLSQTSGTIDTVLLKSMLDQARLALEQGEISNEEAIPFLTKLQKVNTYQKKTLKIIQPLVDSSSREVLNRAIQTCNRRGDWLMQIINEETVRNTDAVPHTPKTEKSVKRKWQWGPGCGCN